MMNSLFLDDPYPAYHAMRAAGPLHWNTDFCGGAWLLTHYADVASVLRDPRFSVRRAGGWINGSGPAALVELREFKRIFPRSLLFTDAPRHTRLRRVVSAGFKPFMLQSLAPRIESVVDALLRAVVASAEGSTHTFDFMRDFARPLPALVIAEMLGVDGADRAQFVAWSDDVADFIGSPTPNMDVARRAQAGLSAMTGYFRDLLPQRRQRPGDDLISQLIRAEADGGILTANELLAQCCTLLFAGHETTRNLLGNGMLALLRHPEQWRALQREPALMSLALRELLRFDSPVLYTGRRLKVDVELHGKLMKKGDLVIPLIGAANRDPAKFTAPDALDIRRDEGGHLSFGYGPHVCVGAALTYLEGDIALRGVMRYLPELRLTDAPVSWRHNAVYRGLDTLPLRFTPALDDSIAEPKSMSCV